MSDNWKDIFGNDSTDDATNESDDISKNVHSMTDEELDAYLRSYDIPDDGGTSPEADFSDTMISGWLPPAGEIKSRAQWDENDGATSVIPSDVKRISDITNKNKKINSDVIGVSENDEQYRGRDYKLVRQKKNTRFGCMGGFMYFTFIIGLGIIFASLGWLAASDVLALNKEPKTATIEILDNFDMDDLIDELKEKGIIEYKFLFKLFAKFSEAEGKIDPGTYELNTEYDYRAIVSKMQEGSDSMVTVKVTIPEGKTLQQTFDLLAENKVCKAEELWEAAADFDFQYDFLDPATLGNELRLEGYLFPDTYEFYASSDPEDVIEKFLDNFDNRITETMYNQAELKGLSMNQILTIASLIEMEAGSNEERGTIGSVIYNRIESDYGYLQIDATVQYILEERKEKLSYEDLLIDNPYNTYMYKGLPPGPIANPGLSSIMAALEPEDTNYFFYALNKEGTHKFFTYNESDEFEAFTESDEFGG